MCGSIDDRDGSKKEENSVHEVWFDSYTVVRERQQRKMVVKMIKNSNKDTENGRRSLTDAKGMQDKKDEEWNEHWDRKVLMARNVNSFIKLLVVSIIFSLSLQRCSLTAMQQVRLQQLLFYA